MKFIVTARTKEAYNALPLETRMELMQGSVAFVEKNRKAGKCKDIYFHADLMGDVSIWEVGSDEEAIRNNLENPMQPYTDFDIRPLIEWDAVLKAITKYYKQAAKK